MHREDVKAGLIVRVTELGIHVIAYMHPNSAIYVTMVCKRRYLASRCTPINLRTIMGTTLGIACDPCYAASLADKIIETGTVPSTPSRERGKRSSLGRASTVNDVRAVLSCVNTRCTYLSVEFAASNPYEAACPKCGKKAVWRRGLT